jgi:aerobic carbon-monoxide dehydrogenase large subunit
LTRPGPRGAPGGLRAEDRPLLTGTAAFVADLAFPGQLAARVVRSPVAHASLTSLDLAEARALPGVHGVWTAADLAAGSPDGTVPRIRSRLGADAAVAEPYLQPLLADGRVRYVGEPVALVVADDAYVAEDAAELVFPEFTPLPAVNDVRAAAAPSAPALFPGGNEVTTLHARLGDPDAAFAAAPVVVEAEIAVERHSAVPMETRGAVAVPEPAAGDDGAIALYGAAKVPHWNRDEITRELGLRPGQLRLVETAVGGSFGVRGELYPEDVLVVWAARRLGRPVGWVEDRWEHLVAANHGRGQVHRAALAGTEDGRILALRTEAWVDLGAYVRTNGLRVPELTLGMLPGPYAIEHYDGVGHVVATTRTPLGTYRGPGRVESAFVRERLVDLYAARIGRDPVAVRTANLLRPGAPGVGTVERQPLATGPRVVLHDGDFAGLVERVMAAVPRDALARRRAAGERVGVGLGLFFERAGTGPWECASLALGADGRFLVRAGATSVGQGVRTALATIAAAALGCARDDVTVAPLDTRALPAGTGTFGSRTTTMAGNAVHRAAIDLVDRARALVAADAGVDVADVAHDAAGVHAAGRTWGWPEVGALAEAGSGDGLVVEARFEMAQPNTDFGAHAAVARVDGDTGQVVVELLVVGFDLGPAVDRRMVEGQLRGAAVQALGGTLYERFAYDDEGNPQVTSFLDYLVPTSAEAPEVVVVLDEDHPSPFNPLGLKGVGEGGMTGVMPAVAAAVSDALGDPGAILRAPVRPDDVHAAATRQRPAAGPEPVLVPRRESP